MLRAIPEGHWLILSPRSDFDSNGQRLLRTNAGAPRQPRIQIVRWPFPVIRRRLVDFVGGRRDLPVLPILERQRDPDFARADFFVDTHGVMESRASTPLLENQLDADRQPTRRGRRKLQDGFRLQTFRDGRV